MIAYSYSPDTGEYLGTTVAFESPLEPDVFSEPANSTFIAPPEAPPGQVAVFGGQDWSVTEDHRGKTAYDAEGAEYKIDALGPLPDGLTWEYEPPFDVLKAQAKQALSQRYQQARDQGVSVGGVMISTTHESHQKLSALVNRLSAPDAPPTFKAVTRSGEPVAFDLAMAQACLEAVDQHYIAVTEREYELMVELVAAADQSALDAVDIDSGWP